jgi:hypothetical protein
MRLTLLEDDVVVEPAAATPWLIVWSLAKNRVSVALPQLRIQREVEPQVSQRQLQGRSTEVVPCYEYRAVRNTVLGCLAPNTAVARSVTLAAARIVATCLDPAARGGLGVLLGNGAILLLQRGGADSDGQLVFSLRSQLNWQCTQDSAVITLCLWRSYGEWAGWWGWVLW